MVQTESRNVSTPKFSAGPATDVPLEDSSPQWGISSSKNGGTPIKNAGWLLFGKIYCPMDDDHLATLEMTLESPTFFRGI